MPTPSILDRRNSFELTDETVLGIQDLIYGLNDSVKQLRSASTKVKESLTADRLLQIADERANLADALAGLVTLADKAAENESTLRGSLRANWTAFKTVLNAGDNEVALSAIEEFDKSLMVRFKEVLSRVAGNRINDLLLNYFADVKASHERVVQLRQVSMSS